MSRQIGALERELRAPLFHRHTRGLILTEQGELLWRAAREMTQRLERTRSQLSETREHPSGELKVTATRGLGGHWLTPRLAEFLDLYPDIKVDLILTDEELDLSMREADIAIRLRQPQQPDLIQRKLFTVHFHVYGSPAYIKRFGEPKSYDDLDNHRLLTFGGTSPSYLTAVHWLGTLGREQRNPRTIHLTVNNITAMKRAVDFGRRHRGAARLPDRDRLAARAADARDRDAAARELSRLSRGDEVGRPRAGLPRLPDPEGAALDVLSPGRVTSQLDDSQPRISNALRSKSEAGF